PRVARCRRTPSENLQPFANGCGLLQVSQQDRSGRCRRSAAAEYRAKESLPARATSVRAASTSRACACSIRAGAGVNQAKRNVVASVLARLRNETAEQGGPFEQVLQLYAIERFLYRLSKSPHAHSVVLKGARLLKTIGIPRARPTMDIDLLRQGKSDRDTLI